MDISVDRKVSTRKSQVINLRVTSDEFSAINSQCTQAGITRSAYILQAVMNKRVLTKIDAQTVFQLRKIGINLNQITKQVHIISKFVDKKEQELPDILKEISSIRAQIDSISHHILQTHAG